MALIILGSTFFGLRILGVWEGTVMRTIGYTG
jgi:hypothetical protein